MLRSAMLLGMSLATVAVLVTGAIFTDTQSVGANLFTAGTVDISTSPATALVTMNPMAPGDSAPVGKITVTNSGTLQLRYAITSTTTENVLAMQLSMTVWDEAAEADGGTDCATTAPAGALYGPLTHDPPILGHTTTQPIVGNATQGSQAGDRVLAASANEVLCFKVTLPLSTGNAYQGLTTTATFNFIAEQTANN